MLRGRMTPLSTTRCATKTTDRRPAGATPRARLSLSLSLSLSLAMLTIVVMGAPMRADERPSSADERPPNIVLIYIDDMGWRDASFAGSDLYETPNIDRLAREGLVFTDAYAPAGNCQPSRACLLSGQYTPRHGVYAVQSTERGPKRQMRLNPIPNTQELATASVTFAEALRERGYATGLFGKWHTGKTPETRPSGQGFDVDEMVSPPSAREFERTDDPKRIYSITDGACAFIEANRERPFLAYVSHHATHMGIQARRELVERFEKKRPGTLHQHLHYAAMNAQMDDGVGRLLARIRELDLEKRTVVVFTADNGGLPQSPQTPLRGFKGMYYEGGIRVPMIVRWPGITRPGSRTSVPSSHVDLFPTFLEIAGASVPAGKTLDGVSLLPALRGETKLRRDAIFWHFPGYLDAPNPGSRDGVFRTRPVTVIRKGRFKLHLFHEEWTLDGGREQLATNRAVELYDLESDLGETHDLALERTETRDELLDDLLAWMARVNAKIPTEAHPAYDPGSPPEGRARRRERAER